MHLLVDAPKRLRLLHRLFLYFQTSDRVKIAKVYNHVLEVIHHLAFWNLFHLVKQVADVFLKISGKKLEIQYDLKLTFYLTFHLAPAGFNI